MMKQWETDEQGRRFRRIGKGCIEYEMMVHIDGREIPQSELEDYNRKKARAQPIQLDPKREIICPFTGGLLNTCEENCALYANGCTFARIASAEAATDTKGRSCPFNPYPCRTDCALYRNGCILTAIK